MTQAPPTFPEPPPAPTFVPSEQAVNAVAGSLYAQFTDGVAVDGTKLPQWSALSAVEKTMWRTRALTSLIAAGPDLVVTALSHVTTNHTVYGFSDAQRDELIFAQQVTDMTEELTAMLSREGDDETVG